MTGAHPIAVGLRAIVGPDGVLDDPDELLAYESDGLPIARGIPMAVVFPTETAQVAACTRLLLREGVGVVPRGSGTGLTGGCVAFDGGVIISASRMTRIESIDLMSRVAVVQAGVRNADLSAAVAVAGRTEARYDSDARVTSAGSGPGQEDDTPANWWFSPDPSSRSVATIGGNAATNAGGLNTLKHGVTTSHILGMEFVTPRGQVVTTRTGGLCDGVGADLTALICGSEGTLGVITRLWCRLVPKPRCFRTVYAVFDASDSACRAVGDVIAAGIVPGAMEMLDGAMIRVVEEAFGFGFPAQARALLLIELDGVGPVLDEQLDRVVSLCRSNGARQVQHCSDPARRDELWQVRKRAFGAIGRISRSYCTQDACIPRSKLPQALRQIGDIGRRHGLWITNVFHAGDGNVHPILLFDEDDPCQVQRVLKASEEILELCIELGGTMTGEHGVGIEKLHLMPKQFNGDTMGAFDRIKAALDPQRLCNEGKLIPSDRLRIELVRPIKPNVPGGAM